MRPRLAIQTTASARVAASPLASAFSASPRDFGGSGNAGNIAAVSAVMRSRLRIPEREIAFMKLKLFVVTILSLSIAGAALAAGDPPPPPERKKDAVLDSYTL